MTHHPTQPHSDDVLERQTTDNGFSAGWGLHFKPSVQYWLDCHTHARDCDLQSHKAMVADWHNFMWGHRLRRHVAIDGYPQNAEQFAEVAREDDRLLWLSRLDPDQPDSAHLRKCKELGAIGLKLHNMRLIIEGMPLQTVLSPAWHEVYATAGQLNMPILWHVTQRLTTSPYSGGGKSSYWRDAHQRGITHPYNNFDLLDAFLEAVAKHPKTNFIGAHQLHIGPEKMASLFDKYPNLYVDTSIGCFVAADDTMYESDRARWREFAIAYQDRLLFGSDVVITPKTVNTELLRQHFLGHVRWVKQLNLPQDALTKIAHANFERIAGLSQPAMFPWGALRP